MIVQKISKKIVFVTRLLFTQSAAPSSPASQRAPEQEDRQRTRVGGNRSSWNFTFSSIQIFLGYLSNLAANASLVPEYCKRLNLKECWLDSGHCEGDRLDIVGCQSVAPEIVTKCNWADWLHQKMIKLSKSSQKLSLPGKFNISDIECILVLDEGQALARAG